MGDGGNEYDGTPPERSDGHQRQAESPRLMEMVSWLTIQLQPRPKMVSVTRKLAEEAGFNANLLYRGKDYLHVEEYESEGKKWWRLMEEESKI